MKLIQFHSQQTICTFSNPSTQKNQMPVISDRSRRDRALVRRARHGSILLPNQPWPNVYLKLEHLHDNDSKHQSYTICTDPAGPTTPKSIKYIYTSSPSIACVAVSPRASTVSRAVATQRRPAFLRAGGALSVPRSTGRRSRGDQS